ncbi:MAG: DUF664 domain-containing protein [Acidobacteria bacterium]|nr:MAG: DUF664 domain-containing protein [Acidobacteriota bacterium]
MTVMDNAQAKFLMEQLTGLWESEFAMTCKVLEAVPDDKRDYKPDPKSRSAWDLTTHLATADIWFLDSIINAQFNWDPEAAKAAAAGFKTVAEVVAFYKREFPARLATLRGMPADQLARQADFFGLIKGPAAQFLGLANNHSVHHRGQLATHLRAMGSKVPPIYGDSADHPMGS